LIVQRSKYLDDCLQVMKGIIMNVMQKEFNLLPKEPPEEPAKKQAPPRPEPARFQPARLGRRESEGYSDGSEDDVPAPGAAPVRPAETQPVVFDTLFVVQNPKGPRIMLQAAIDAIQFCPEIVIRELFSIILPPPVVLSVPVVMQKARTHEDFIPGRLPREPTHLRVLVFCSATFETSSPATLRWTTTM
jgi:hypothetical protein